MTHWVDVHRPGAAAERFALEGTLVFIVEDGEGRLVPRDDASGRPGIELVPGSAGVKIAVRRGFPGRARAHGAEVQQTLLAWGDDLFVDDVRLAFLQRAKGGSRVFVLVATVLAGATVVLGALREPSARGRANDPKPPPLAAAEKSCTASGEAAEARAREAERRADAKRARYPFDPSDGVETLPLLEEAASCFRAAGRIEDARRSRAALDTWRERLDGDYASLRLALRGALAENRSNAALEAVRDLESLLSGRRDDPYFEWLESKRRELERTLARSSKR